MTQRALIDLAKAIKAQIVVALLVLVFWAVSDSSQSIVRTLPDVLMRLLEQYGIGILAVASFIENLPGLSMYFPGSIVILVAMASTAGQPAKAFLAYLAIVGPAIVANLISYALGAKTRSNSVQLRQIRSRSLFLWYASTYWHPQLAGLTAAASGASGIPFRRYLRFFLPVSLTWTVIWAVTLYQIGAVVKGGEVLEPLFYIYLVLWTGWGIVSHLRKRRDTPLGELTLRQQGVSRKHG